MSTNLTAKSKKKIIKSDRARAYAFRRTNFPLETKKQSMQACNYLPGTSASQIEKQPAYKNAIEELRALAMQSKCDPASQLTFFQEMRDNKSHTPTSRIESGKEINRMLGYHAPTQVEVESQVTQNVSVLVGMLRLNGASVGDLIANARQNGNLVKQMPDAKCVQQYANDNDTQ